jgi:8-oxo-dGTP diphosphatase
LSVYVVRHAKAGDRSKWTGPDELRPVSDKGKRQAEALADLLADQSGSAGTAGRAGSARRARRAGSGIRRIMSSPFLRCVQTVEPLAARLGLEVETDDALAEGAGEDEVVDLVRKVASENPVLCSHGDVIPTLLDALARRDGLRLPKNYPCAKGSTWVLDQDEEGRFVSAIYLPAP